MVHLPKDESRILSILIHLLSVIPLVRINQALKLPIEEVVEEAIRNISFVSDSENPIKMVANELVSSCRELATHSVFRNLALKSNFPFLRNLED